MQRIKFCLTILALLTLFMTVLPVNAARAPVASSEIAGQPGTMATALDREQRVHLLRRNFRPTPRGLGVDSGRLKADLDAWGLTFIPYTAGSLRPDRSFGYRLKEVWQGDQALYIASSENGVAPAVMESPDRAGYARTAGIWEVYQALDFEVEQLFILSRPLTGTGDLVLVG